MSRFQQSALVLHESIGDNPRADEIDTLEQAKYVTDVMHELGWSASRMATGLDLATTIAAIRVSNPVCVFNLVESLHGDGSLVHIVPAVLRSAGIRFTGSDSDATFLSSHKLLAKHIMRLNGIPTPVAFQPGEPKPAMEATWIVKSVWEHASLGLDDGCVVNSLSAARARVDHCRAQFGGNWFAEQFIDGREFNVSVLEIDRKPRILPIAEMTFVDYPSDKPKIVGYAAKWDDAAPEYSATARSFAELPRAEYAVIVDVVQKCWDSFNMRGYARVDIRLDSNGVPWVLEVNANPCLSPEAGFAAACNKASITMQTAIEHIVSAAVN
ncbi:MAG TPA: hypothetical protein PKH39_04075 [Woeseiaceae bacterium]|nr:hypothetical protein [Woeseiaceae bacterium]